MQSLYILKRGALLPLALWFSFGFIFCTRESGSKHEQHWLTITHNGIWERVIDVSDWEKKVDILELDRFRFPVSVYYPWQGEDSIDYSIQNELLWINGEVAGLVYDFYGYSSKGTLPATVKPENILVVMDKEINTRELSKFKNLQLFYLHSDSVKDLNELRNIPKNVDIYCRVKSNRLKELVGLSNLRGMEVGGTIDDLDVDIAFLEKFKSLTYLYTGSYLEEADFESIAKLDSLRILYLGQAGQTPCNKYLRHLKKLKRLRTLLLTDMREDKEGLGYITDIKSLHELYISHFVGYESRISSDGYKLFRKLPMLNTLYLDDFEISKQGMKQLGKLQNLRELYFLKVHLNPPDLVYLSNLTNLKSLHFLQVGLGDTGVTYLKGIKNLKTLELDANIWNPGLVRLKDIDMENLDLFFGGLNDSGLTLLGELSQLKYFKLSAYNAASDSAWMKLANLRNLRRLELHTHNLKGSILTKLRDTLPGCKIVYEE